MTHHLAENQLAGIAEQLHVQRLELLEQMREELRESEQAERFDRYSQLNDAGDYSVADLMRDMKLDQLDRETEKLQAIESAEVRMQKGTYGECVDCGTEIKPERLLAQPTASRCMECQEKYERGHVGRITNKM